MKNLKPYTLYWVRVRKENEYDAIAYIRGETPFLKMDLLMFTNTSPSLIQDADVDEIEEWGPEIKEPKLPVS